MEKQPYPYEDILHLPHHVSKERPHMSLLDRAAQFSPFAALVGYEDFIDETARLTTPERELDEAEKAELDRRVGILAAHLGEKPVVTVEYFVPDTLKSGGAYRTCTGALVRISPVRKTLTLADGTSIRFKDVVGIESELFREEF
ncbi:MAG: hypothetical protein IJT68_10975 [Lentisphaeria bacterium]|nr:hypothetical protein [Lentisphaeria bacterium]